MRGARCGVRGRGRGAGKRTRCGVRVARYEERGARYAVRGKKRVAGYAVRGAGEKMCCGVRGAGKKTCRGVRGTWNEVKGVEGCELYIDAECRKKLGGLRVRC